MDRIKIYFSFTGHLKEMQSIQEQFRASTGMLLTFEGWHSWGVALFRVYSIFA